ncbi:MAG: hypothetical protein HYV35_06935 [Lentisphaerae bacterium]|nr:hypothetical protein [Lentisphaerota bacterium]
MADTISSSLAEHSILEQTQITKYDRVALFLGKHTYSQILGQVLKIKML